MNVLPTPAELIKCYPDY